MAIRIDSDSSMTEKEALAVVGKTIISVEASEFVLKLTLSGGLDLIAKGSEYGGALGIRVDEEV